MRVRIFELRLIAAGLTTLWTIVAALVLLGYRPGGPIDLLVGLAAGPPVVIAAMALVWPPAARDDRVFAVTVWVGLLVGLLLIPSIGGIVEQLAAQGAQTLLPSIEAAYPWLLALTGTCIFAGLGIARRLLGPGSPRRPRLIRGLAVGAVLTLLASSTFAGAAIANELALRDRPATSSRFGPTDPHRVPPACDGPIRVAENAQLQLDIAADVDLHPIGTAHVAGQRSGPDIRWLADVATDRVLGQYGAARVGEQGWLRSPGVGWESSDPATIEPFTLDRHVVETALAAADRTAAEDRGIEFIEGARARHCRIAVDGRTFATAFPEVVWFADAPLDVHRWRGELDYWVFGDGELGKTVGGINGDAAGIGAQGVQGTIRTTMIATDRDRPVTIEPPTG
jgi:hypothetical protein